MALSNSYDWTLNRNQVITGALRKLSVLPSGGAPNANQTNDAAEALNALIKAFHADGMPVWAQVSTTFTPTNGTSTYTIGPGLVGAGTIDAPRPEKLTQALYKIPSGNFVPMKIYTRYDFNMLPGTSSGIPIGIYYQPLTSPNGTVGTLKLWPVPDNTGTIIQLEYAHPLMDMDTTTDNLDFPSYWIQALIYNLAWALCPEYSIPPTDRKMIADEAKYWKDQALSYGTEEGSLFLQPELSWDNK